MNSPLYIYRLPQKLTRKLYLAAHPVAVLTNELPTEEIEAGLQTKPFILPGGRYLALSNDLTFTLQFKGLPK